MFNYMVDILITFLSSIIVPIVVALISSGKVANNVTKKMKLEDLNSKVNNLSDKVDTINNKIDIVDEKVNNVSFENKKDNIILKRSRILRFNGEIMRGVYHSKDEFDDCIEAIDDYEKYCKNNQDFPNNKCHFAVNNIKNEYSERMAKNSF